MDSEKICEVLDEYEVFFNNYGVKPVRHADSRNCCSFEENLAHLLWMAIEIRKFLEANKVEKAMRWLGFIQGSLWSNRLQTIAQLKTSNRPR